MKTNIILSVIAFTLVTGYKATAQTLGNACGSTSNPLTTDWEIPLDGYTFNFSEQATTPLQVRIGYTNCTPSTVGRLNVLNDILQVAGYFQTSVNTSTVSLGTASFAENTGGDAIGIYAEAVSNSSISHAIGVNANSVNGTNAALKHTAVDANAANGTWQSFAVNGDIKNSMSDENYGYQTEIYNAKSTSLNYGFHGWVNTPGSTNYGMLVDVSGATNNYGVYASVAGSSPNNYAGYFNGDVARTGTDNFTSDSTLKQNIKPITNARGIIRHLLPKTYEFNHSIHPNMMLPNGKQWGLLSQQVATVLPELVTEVTHPARYDSLGKQEYASFTYKALNYQAFTGILIQAVKEQDIVIDSLVSINNKQDNIIINLNNRLTRLENCLNGTLPYLCQLSHGLIQENSPQTQELISQQLSVYLSSKESIVLDQNIPNPFAEQTVINFSIPESVKSAQIHFYDGRGNLIKSIEISQRGLGSITLFGADLSSGTYLYSLVADGIVVASKKMLKE